MKSTTISIKPSDTAGTKAGQAQNVAQALGEVLSHTYMLYLKTQNFHWNVEGPRFYSIHKLTESQYLAMVQAIDTLAERIRALGFYAPGTFRDFSKMSEIEEPGSMPIGEEAMLSALVQDHMTATEHIKRATEVSDEAGDSATSDILNDRREFHEKAAWMLRSLNKIDK